MDTIKSLRAIPSALFFEFVVPDVQLHKRFGFTKAGMYYEMVSGLSRERHSDGVFTLVLLECVCQDNRHHRDELLFFEYPVKLGDFETEESSLSPTLTIKFWADDPPYSPNRNLYWVKGRGYWVGEHLDAKYGSSPNGFASIISPNLGAEDWEFTFLLKVQKRASELVSEVPNRGHWQFEWDPHGAFLNSQ